MKRIYLGGAGGAPTNNVIASLRATGDEYLIGTSCVPTDLFLADVDERRVVPPALDPAYKAAAVRLVKETRPDFLHLQNDFEIRAVSRFRDDLLDVGVKLFMPSAQVIENCVDKHASYRIWRKAGVRTPKTILLKEERDLKAAFDQFDGELWLRAIEGGGGKGALPTNSYEFARLWIDRFDGWGEFTAAELLTPDTVTWLAIWHEGELVVAQTRRRKGWSMGDRTLSGVTGITAVGETWSNDSVTQLALDAIATIDPRPHGIYGVDMTYDRKGMPNVTEINISRFFTTVHFFTAAGINFPRIFVDIGLYGLFPSLGKKINPLPDGLLWVRGMDRAPVLTTTDAFSALLEKRA